MKLWFQKVTYNTKKKLKDSKETFNDELLPSSYPEN